MKELKVYNIVLLIVMILIPALLVDIKQEKGVFMKEESLLNLVKKVCQEEGVEWELVWAIIQVESKGNPNAIRFEPNFYAKYIDHLPFISAEKICRACSFGLMQIMGETARELGFDQPWNKFFDPAFNVRVGIKFIKRIMSKCDDYERIANYYNTGINSTYWNEDYVRKVMAELQKIKAENMFAKEKNEKKQEEI